MSPIILDFGLISPGWSQERTFDVFAPESGKPFRILNIEPSSPDVAIRNASTAALGGAQGKHYRYAVRVRAPRNRTFESHDVRIMTSLRPNPLGLNVRYGSKGVIGATPSSIAVEPGDSNTGQGSIFRVHIECADPNEKVQAVIKGFPGASPFAIESVVGAQAERGRSADITVRYSAKRGLAHVSTLSVSCGSCSIEVPLVEIVKG